MKMKPILKLFILATFLYPLTLKGQTNLNKLELSLYGGAASYMMDNLKSLNAYNSSQLPFSIDEINNFDPGFYFGASLQARVSKKMYLALFYQYYNTGSRFGKKDYSGYYVFDQIANANYMGLEPGITLLNKKAFCLSTSLQIGALFSKTEMREYIQVLRSDDSFSQDLSAFSIAFSPSVKLSLPVIKSMKGFLSVGGMLDTAGTLHIPGNKDAVLTVVGQKAGIDWSGFRITAGLNIKLSK
jgi:hypothetical protein